MPWHRGVPRATGANRQASAEPRRDIWTWGLRNPWRIWVDPKTGRVWTADVGDIASSWPESERTRLASGFRRWVDATPGAASGPGPVRILWVPLAPGDDPTRGWELYWGYPADRTATVPWPPGHGCRECSPSVHCGTSQA